MCNTRLSLLQVQLPRHVGRVLRDGFVGAARSVTHKSASPVHVAMAGAGSRSAGAEDPALLLAAGAWRAEARSAKAAVRVRAKSDFRRAACHAEALRAKAGAGRPDGRHGREVRIATESPTHERARAVRLSPSLVPSFGGQESRTLCTAPVRLKPDTTYYADNAEDRAILFSLSHEHGVFAQIWHSFRRMSVLLSSSDPSR